MKGAIIGDIIGSAYEFHNIDTKDFPLFNRHTRFTDDTVMTCAVAKALLESDSDVSDVFHEVGRKYPDAGYGNKFYRWMLLDADPQPSRGDEGCRVHGSLHRSRKTGQDNV